MRRGWIICALLAAITLAVYWPVRHHDFICYDDDLFVTANPYVRVGLSAQGIRYALTTPVAENWHPVTVLSHMFDCELFGVNPGPQHLLNVLLHVANALLLFLLLRRTTGAPWRSAIVAAVLALHPLHVESVAWISERKNILSFFFFMLTLWAYVRYVEETEGRVNNAETRTRRGALASTQNAPRWDAKTWQRLALLFYALGLMAKPVLVTAPFILLLLDFWPLGRFEHRTFEPGLPQDGSIIRDYLSILGKLIWEKWRFFVLSLALCWITVRVESGAGGIETLSDISFTDRMGNAVVSYLKYLGQLFWPTNLAVLYPHPGRNYPFSDHWPPWEIWTGVLLLIAISALCVFQLRQRPYLAVGWFWYVGSLVPVIGLVQVGEQAMADRHTYIPLIGFTFGLVWIISELSSNRVMWRTSLSAAAVLAIASCAWLTHRQVGFWKNSITLFEHTVNVTADNPIAQCNLGYGLFLEGKPSRAAVHYRVALAINPRYAQAHFNLAGVFRNQERWPEAVEHYLAVTRLRPDFFLPHLALAQILPRLGRTKEAAAQMEEFLRTCPSANLTEPNSPVRDVALAALNDLAWLLATAERAEDRDGERAVRFAERACTLTEYQATVLVGTLAAAYAESGRFEEATATAERAIALATASNDQALLARNQQLLEIYRSSRPWREPAAPATH